jgi:hypothetical protein
VDKSKGVGERGNTPGHKGRNPPKRKTGGRRGGSMSIFRVHPHTHTHGLHVSHAKHGGCRHASFWLKAPAHCKLLSSPVLTYVCLTFPCSLCPVSPESILPPLTLQHIKTTFPCPLRCRTPTSPSQRWTLTYLVGTLSINLSD